MHCGAMVRACVHLRGCTWLVGVRGGLRRRTLHLVLEGIEPLAQVRSEHARAHASAASPLGRALGCARSLLWFEEHCVGDADVGALCHRCCRSALCRLGERLEPLRTARDAIPRSTGNTAPYGIACRTGMLPYRHHGTPHRTGLRARHMPRAGEASAAIYNAPKLAHALWRLGGGSGIEIPAGWRGKARHWAMHPNRESPVHVSTLSGESPALRDTLRTTARRLRRSVGSVQATKEGTGAEAVDSTVRLATRHSVLQHSA